MNTGEIGSYIALKRKDKGLTQAKLGEMLGVSDKTVSRWERGNYMPDISLLIPLAEILDVTTEELLSGHDIEKDEDSQVLKDTITYTGNEIIKERNRLNILVTGMGILLMVLSLVFFSKESGWSIKCLLLGMIIMIIGIYRMMRRRPLEKVMICMAISLICSGIIMTADYIAVKYNHEIPMLAYSITTKDRLMIYKTPLYNFYRVNPYTSYQYYIFDDDKSMNEDDILILPFDYNKSGYDSIIDYKSPYLGDNSNTVNIINKLPLSEYGAVIRIDSDNCILMIDYGLSSWYVDEEYLKECLLYNTVSLYYLIDNLEGIEYNLVGNTYISSKEDMRKYPGYYKIKDKDSFEEYVSYKINDISFIDTVFDSIIHE